MLAQQFLVLLAAILLLTTTAQAENWPQFRGPTRQGLSTETNLPITWSTTSNILWKTAIPGDSWSSPITWNDRIFVTTATDNGQSCRVLSLNASSGAILWDLRHTNPSHRRRTRLRLFWRRQFRGLQLCWRHPLDQSQLPLL